MKMLNFYLISMLQKILQIITNKTWNNTFRDDSEVVNQYMPTQTPEGEPLRKITVVICNHQAGYHLNMAWYLLWQFANRESMMSFMTLNVLSENRCC